MNAGEMNIQIGNYPALSENPFLYVDSTGNMSQGMQTNNESQVEDEFKFMKERISGFFDSEEGNELQELKDIYFSDSNIEDTLTYIFEGFIKDIIENNTTDDNQSNNVEEVVLKYDPVFRFVAISSEIDKMNNNDSVPDNISTVLNSYKQYQDKSQALKDIEKYIADDSNNPATDNVIREIYKPAYNLVKLEQDKKNYANSVISKRLMALAEIHYEYFFFMYLLYKLTDKDEGNEAYHVIDIANNIRIPESSLDNTTNETQKASRVRYAMQVIVDILNAQQRRMYQDEWAIAYLRAETQNISKEIKNNKEAIKNTKKDMSSEAHSMSTMQEKINEQKPVIRRSLLFLIFYIILVLLFIALHFVYFFIFSDNGSMISNPKLSRIAKTTYAKTNILLITNLTVLIVVMLVRLLKLVSKRNVR